MENKTKNICILFLISSFVFLPISPTRIFFQLTNAEDENSGYCENRDTGYCSGDYVVIDRDTTWSGNISYPDKPVVVVDWNTLTIEKGAHIEINKLIVAEYGRVVAEGTKEENIYFTKSKFDASKLTDKQKQYDQKCFMEASGTIDFESWVGWDDQEPSIFKYVEFNRMGTDLQFDDENCPGGNMAFFEDHKSSIFNTAYAQTQSLRSPVIKYSYGMLKIENATFKNNAYADIEVDVTKDFRDDRREYRDYLWVENSNFENNSQNTAIISSFKYDDADNASRIQLKNNWYGDASGPESISNPDGKGEKVIGTATVPNWSSIVIENSAIANGVSNIMFLPGIKASHLYKDGALGTEDELWIPNFFGNDVNELDLDNDGKSINDVYTRDIVKEDPVGNNIYKTFADNLKSLKNSGTINDYNLFAYDWRQSVEDVAKNGTQYSGEIKSAITTLTSLAESSKSKKVTIIAHSNGGLLAKAIMLELDDQGLSDKVDKIIFVGSPQMGTPLSVLSMLYGYDESALFGTLILRADSRTLAEDMPGAYGLLPSKKYFDRMGNPFISFSSSQTRYKSFIDAYGEKINNFDEFKNFILGKTDEREKPDKNELENENVLNEKLFDQAVEMHKRLDDWTPPSNINVIQIAGWGLDTISGVDYTEKEETSCDHGVYSFPICSGNGKYDPIYEPKFTVDGDNVVVAPSALMLDDTTNIKKYWVDLWSYNKGFTINRGHKDLLEVDSVEKLISNVINNNYLTSSLPEFIKTSRPSDYDNAKPHLRMSLYSPLDINLYDDAGNHTGPKTIAIDGGTKTILEEGIPNSYYYQFGDRKYVGMPSGEYIQMEMNGYDSGVYTLKIEEIKTTESGDETISQTTFADLPVSSETKVKLDIPQTGLENLSNLQADYNGDGTNDYTVTPVPNGIATFADTIAPETKIELAGTQGENDWRTSNVPVILSAQDNENGSGVDYISYSLDDGATWNNYSDPINISQEGTIVVKYFAVDKQGNKEEPKTETIKIDKTAPEIKIISPENKAYLNNKQPSLNYVVSDSQSGINSQSIFWDDKIYVKNNVDLSLVSFGEHMFKITAKNYAGNVSEKKIKLSLATNPSTIIENVEHYFNLGLIKNKSEKKFLAAQLSAIEQNTYLFNVIKSSPFFNQKTKDALGQVIRKITNNQIDLLIYQINHNSSAYDKLVKEILIQSLNFVRI